MNYVSPWKEEFSVKSLGFRYKGLWNAFIYPMVFSIYHILCVALFLLN